MSGRLICKGRAAIVGGVWESNSLQILSWLLFGIAFPGAVPEYLRCFLK